MISFPGFPDFGVITGSCLFAVADNGGLHQCGIVKDLVFLGPLVLHVFHERYLRILAFPVDEVINAADCPKNIQDTAGKRENAIYEFIRFYTKIIANVRRGRNRGFWFIWDVFQTK